MSSTELVKGKFVLVPKGDLTVEQLCESFYRRIMGKELNEELADSYEEALLDAYYDQYFVYNDNLYLIIEQNDYSDDSICEVNMIGSGVYEFMASFYNGGTCLTEMLGEGLSKTKL